MKKIDGLVMKHKNNFNSKIRKNLVYLGDN